MTDDAMSIDKVVESPILSSFAHDDEFPQLPIIFKTTKRITVRNAYARQKEMKQKY